MSPTAKPHASAGPRVGPAQAQLGSRHGRIAITVPNFIIDPCRQCAGVTDNEFRLLSSGLPAHVGRGFIVVTGRVYRRAWRLPSWLRRDRRFRSTPGTISTTFVRINSAPHVLQIITRHAQRMSSIIGRVELAFPKAAVPRLAVDNARPRASLTREAVPCRLSKPCAGVRWCAHLDQFLPG